MTTSKGLGISIKYGDQSPEMELRVNRHALGVRVPQGVTGVAWPRVNAAALLRD
jgi:hypothetical protein